MELAAASKAESRASRAPLEQQTSSLDDVFFNVSSFDDDEDDEDEEELPAFILYDPEDPPDPAELAKLPKPEKKRDTMASKWRKERARTRSEEKAKTW